MLGTHTRVPPVTAWRGQDKIDDVLSSPDVHATVIARLNALRDEVALVSLVHCRVFDMCGI